MIHLKMSGRTVISVRFCDISDIHYGSVSISLGDFIFFFSLLLLLLLVMVAFGWSPMESLVQQNDTELNCPPQHQIAGKNTNY